MQKTEVNVLQEMQARIAVIQQEIQSQEQTGDAPGGRGEAEELV